MARRSGRMFLSKQNPMLTQKFGPVDPDYASNYDVLPGGRINTTRYEYGANAHDLNGGLMPAMQQEAVEKTEELKKLRKLYGADADNYIAGLWQEGVVDSITRGSINRMEDETTMQKAQDKFLQAMEVQERMDQQMGLRDTKGRVRRAKQTWNAMYGGKENW